LLFTAFGIARDFNGLCNLRYDDTNPTNVSRTNVVSELVLASIADEKAVEVGITRTEATTVVGRLKPRTLIILKQFAHCLHRQFGLFDALQNPLAGGP
jgi:hypothetical protein